MINFDKIKKESKIMKKITYNLKEVFKENSTVIKDERQPFPQNVIFYIIGLIFEPEKGKTRKQVEEEGLKIYKGELRTPFIADNEYVFLNNFFKRGYHKNIDLLHILTNKEVNNIINLSVKEDLQESKSFFKSLFEKKEDYLIFLKEDNLKERNYVKITYNNKAEKEKYILKMQEKGWLAYFCESDKNVKRMNFEMKEAQKKNEKYFPSFYASNPANWLYEKIDIHKYLSDEDIQELNEDKEYQRENEEIKKINEEYREKNKLNDSHDENEKITYHRLTGFKYS